MSQSYFVWNNYHVTMNRSMVSKNKVEIQTVIQDNNNDGEITELKTTYYLSKGFKLWKWQIVKPVTVNQVWEEEIDKVKRRLRLMYAVDDFHKKSNN